jgi:hypothetical protein
MNKIKTKQKKVKGNLKNKASAKKPYLKYKA